MGQRGVIKCSAEGFLLAEGEDPQEYLNRLLWDIDIDNAATRWNTAEFVEGHKDSRIWVVPSSLLLGAARKLLLAGIPLPMGGQVKRHRKKRINKKWLKRYGFNPSMAEIIGFLVNNKIHQFVGKMFTSKIEECVDIRFLGILPEGSTGG